VVEQGVGLPQHFVEIKLILIQLPPLRLQLGAEGYKLAPMVKEVTGEYVVVPALNLDQAVFDLRESGTRGEEVSAELAGDGLRGDRSPAGGERIRRLQYAQRYLKRKIRRERCPLWTMSRHHGTSDAVVIRSSPFLPVGAAGSPTGRRSIISR